MNLIVSAGWSYGNIGDEVIASSTIYLNNMYFPEYEKIYSAYSPESFKVEHREENVICSLHNVVEKLKLRFEDLKDIKVLIQREEFRYFKDLFEDDSVFIMSGGGYFHEQWETQFIARILEIEIAAEKTKQVYMLGQSIGPIYDEQNKILLNRALQKCKKVWVRDRQSQYFLNSFCKGLDILLAPDVAMITSDYIKKEGQEQKIINIMAANYCTYTDLNDRKKKTTTMDRLINKFSINRLKYSHNYKKIIKSLLQDSEVKLYFVLSTNWSWDRRFTERLTKSIPKERYEIFYTLNHVELCNILSNGRITISTKMHPLIVSSSYSVPVIAISYNYKIDGFMELLQGGKNCYNINHLNAKTVEKAVKSELDQSTHTRSKEMRNEVYKVYDVIRAECLNICGEL